MPTTITGTDGVSQVQAGAVESGDLPAGSVLQVKHVVTRTDIQVNAQTLIDLGLSLTITPHSVNSSFFLFCTIKSFHGYISDSGYGLVWLKNGSEIRSPNEYYEVLTYEQAYAASGFQLLDSPQTTSAVTYEAKPETYEDKFVRFSRNGSYDHNLTIMEIAG